MPDHNGDILINAEAAARLVRSRDARAALYYLHLLCGGGASAEAAAHALGFSETETLSAQATLAAVGILPAAAPEAVAEDERPSYSQTDITNRLEEDPAFSALQTYARTHLARPLSNVDLSRLLAIYDHLGMPAGEIMLLISYCKMQKGEGARLGMQAVEREAYKWLRAGIDTEQKAEQYLRELEQRDKDAKRLARLFGIKGRELVPGEKKFLESWAQSGLSDEALYAAYDLTVTGTGSLKWRYMDKIIADWRANGVPDPAARASAAKKPQPAAAKPDEPRISAAERLRRLREKAENEE